MEGNPLVSIAEPDIPVPAGPLKPSPSASLAELEASMSPSAASERATARFSALYQQQYPRVVVFLRRRVGEEAVAEDLAAEVFRIAWERVRSTGLVATPGWLFVTAKNLLANRWRAEARAGELRRELGREVGQFARGALFGDDPVAGRVAGALDRLDESHRDLLMARYWDELTGAELAALGECSVGTVWVRLHRARAAFRESYTATAKEES